MSGFKESMHPILRQFQTPYLEARNLLPLLADYANPRDWIARMVKKGELIRLKNGFFLIAERIESSPVPFEEIANLLYGPSYVSLEWALSQYGLIPEGVYVVTSVTVCQAKTFSTPIGSFDYLYLNSSRYAIGIDQKENPSGRYLIATPEKALADLIHFKSRNLKKEDLLIDLIEGRRIEEESLRNLNKKHLSEIAAMYHSRNVLELVNVLGMI
jgi:hypothetical protein